MHFKFIDALRGWAIIGVVLFHCGQHGGGLNAFPVWAQFMIENGQMGVQLFFVISAFTLYHSYIQRKAELQATKNYFIRRFFRIAPMYYVGIAGSILLRFVDHRALSHFSTGWLKVPVAEILANFLFYNSLIPDYINHLVPGGWSISVEAFFYLLAPFLFRYIHSFKGSGVFLTLSIAIQVGLLCFLSGHPYWDQKHFLYFFFFNQLPAFALGMLVYQSLNHPPALGKYWLLFPLIGVAYLFFLPAGQFFLWLLLFGLLVYSAAKNPLRFLVNSFLEYIGKVSFSIYIIHFFVLDALEHFHLVNYLPPNMAYGAPIDYAIRLVLVFSVSTIFASVSFKLVEYPFQRLGASIITYLKKGRESRALG